MAAKKKIAARRSEKISRSSQANQFESLPKQSEMIGFKTK